MPAARRPKKTTAPRDWLTRFHAKIDTGEEFDDCHLWRGAIDDYGYGKVRLPDDTTRAVHIIAWEMATGNKLPTGWHVDHLCRIRRCCNPDHLEAVPHAENVLRGESFTARNARKTHCPKGHEYTDDNIRWHKSANGAPRRECKTCVTQRDRDRRAAKTQTGETP